MAHTAGAEALVLGDRLVEKAFEVFSREDALEKSSDPST